MTQNECIDDIINQLRGGGKQLDYSEDYELYRNTVVLLREKGIIQSVGKTYSKCLTLLGHQIAESGLSYEEWLKPKPTIPTINHGNIIGGNVHGSNLNIDSPVSHTPENNKTSLLEKISWIVGIIVGLIGIYEFFLKSHIRWIP